MTSEFGKIVDIQTNHSTKVYQIQLFSGGMVGNLKMHNVRRIGIISIIPTKASRVPINPTINIGIQRSQKSLNEYNFMANIPKNVFGFESSVAKLQEIMQFLEFKGDHYITDLIMMVLSVNARMVQQIFNKKFPNKSLIETFMHFRERLLPFINRADFDQFGTPMRRTCDSDVLPQLFRVYYGMNQDFGWRTVNWESLLIDVIDVLIVECKREYSEHDQHFRIFDEFLNHKIGKIDFSDGKSHKEIIGFPDINVVLTALRDLLSAKHIILKYIADESKDVHIMIDAAHSPSLGWFLEQRLTHLRHRYAEDRVKEHAYNGTAIQERMIDFFEQYIANPLNR